LHMWCCMSAPLSCFYCAISKLPLPSDSPTYISCFPYTKNEFWQISGEPSCVYGILLWKEVEFRILSRVCNCHGSQEEENSVTCTLVN
jgi:hypothetical protein